MKINELKKIDNKSLYKMIYNLDMDIFIYRFLHFIDLELSYL
jgi:hypothetical protein